MDTAFIKKTRRTARWEWLILHKAILKYRYGSFAQGFYRPQIVLFYLTRPLLLGDFRKSSPVPFFTLKEGVPPLSPKSPFPSGYRGLNR